MRPGGLSGASATNCQGDGLFDRTGQSEGGAGSVAIQARRLWIAGKVAIRDRGGAH